MEQEYKWKLPEGLELSELLSRDAVGMALRSQEHFDMKAVYYDTPDGFFLNIRGALRMRMENDASVCCMKLSVKEEKGCSLREEYETDAASVEEGLLRLPEQGAPAEICAQVRKAGVVELCRTEFIRQALCLEVAEGERHCVGELALDVGSALREGRRSPIRELEFEFSSGDVALFHAFARRLEAMFCLKVQTQSKLVQALNT